MSRDLFVMLGDIVDSQRIEDRERFNEVLRELIADVNETEDGLYADLSVVKGIDEIAGVLTSLGAAYRINKRLVEGSHPERIRMVVVRGEVDIGLDRDSVSAMDGPAFAAADELLRSVERDELYFGLRAGDSTLDALIGDQINLITMTKQDWSDRQLQVARRYEALSTQTAVADDLGITPQAVSKTLRRSRAKQVFRIESRLADAVSGYDEAIAGVGDAR